MVDSSPHHLDELVGITSILDKVSDQLSRGENHVYVSHGRGSVKMNRGTNSRGQSELKITTGWVIKGPNLDDLAQRLKKELSNRWNKLTKEIERASFCPYDSLEQQVILSPI